MALFQEIDLTTFAGGQITAVEPNSVADDIGLQAGDELLAVNGSPVEDVIDVQFHSADETLELLIRRDGEHLLFEAERDYNQSLGLEFAHPTFDTDIRRCNNLCPFCFVLQMAPKFRRTLYIKDDDYRYSFLFGHFVTLTNLSEHDWWRIETMRLSPLYISVHVTDTELRRRFLRNPDAPDVMEQLRWLAERGIEIHTQLVVVPGFIDGPWLERSINELAGLWPAVQSVSVVPVGLTKQHKYGMRPHTNAETAVTLNYVESLQPGFLERFGVRFAYPTDEWYLVAGRDVPLLENYDDQELHENGLGLVRRFLDAWEEEKTEIKDWKLKNHQSSIVNTSTSLSTSHQSLTLVTGTMFAPVLAEKAAEFAQLTGLQVTVLPIVNDRLGATITAAGLLMGGDILQQIKAAGYGGLVILPQVTFAHPDTITLDDLSPQDIAARLNCLVALADTMGDVWDAVTGQSRVIYRPGLKNVEQINVRVLNDADVEDNKHIS
jgi:putative radical SAM enzyme (TIGR03279 family)